MHHLFTTEDIHNTYVAAVPRSAKPWDEEPDNARHFDAQMTHSLTIQEATIRARRELQAVASYVECYQAV